MRAPRVSDFPRLSRDGFEMDLRRKARLSKVSGSTGKIVPANQVQKARIHDIYLALANRYRSVAHALPFSGVRA